MADDSDEIKPFDRGYVMNITANNALSRIDLSVNKTSARLGDFEPDSPKWKEVLDTLYALDKFKKLINDFRLNNPDVFHIDEEN